MRLDGPRLRARRLQLGQTTRGLAREAHVSQTLVKRLETTGELDSVTCATLQHILDALSLDVVQTLDQHEPQVDPDQRNLERLGTILLEAKAGISAVALGALLATDVTAVEAQLDRLAVQLRPAGIRVHRGSAGIRLLPVATTDQSGAVTIQYFDAPTRTDLRLLHRTLTGTLHSREVASMKNGNVSLYRLMKAGLAQVGTDGEVQPGEAARLALLID
ncbi:MAG: helix-turn-helix domain-containing protein [Gaiellaceae bacterium]